MSQTAATQIYKNGQRVRIIDAAAGSPDPKALVYYEFYRNLSGTFVKAYGDGTLALSVDRKSLPPDIRERHEESERVLRDRWLNGLSEEDRNKLTQKEQRFSLKYMLLVSNKHVVPESSDAAPAKAKTQPAAAAESLVAETPSRPSLAELEAREEQYLKSKQNPS